MVGAGVFVNIQPLIGYAGPWSFAGYVVGEMILLPVVISMAMLTSMHAVAGGMLVYPKRYLHAGAGFISVWGYFVGKTASVALLLHVFSIPLHANNPWLQTMPQWTVTYLLIASIALLNIIGLQLGGKVQYLFTTLKLIPFVAIISSGFMRAQPLLDPLFWQMPAGGSIAATIPVAIFALSGFEVICTLGHLVKKPEKNTLPVAVTTALIVASIYAFFQMATFLIAGYAIVNAVKPLEAIAGNLVAPFSSMSFLIDDFMRISMLTGAFNIMSNNAWNLYAIGKGNMLPWSGQITATTKDGIPWAALIGQVLLAWTLLAITNNPSALLNMAVSGAVLAYLLTTLSACVAFWNTSRTMVAIASTGVASCSYVLFLSMQRLAESGISVSYIAIFFAGIIGALMARNTKCGIKTNR